MKEIYVSDLVSGNEITAFFMVKMIGVKLGSNKKQYLDVTLGDKTGEVSSKKWDVDDRELDGLSGIKAGDIVKVKAQVTEWQGMILSHHYEPEFGSPKRPMFPEAELLHYLDILDARMFDMEDALNSTNAGEFSEKVWTLDNRRVYKVSDEK